MGAHESIDADVVVRAIGSILAEEGLDPSPPFDLSLLRAYGIRVRRARYIRPGEMLIMGEFPRSSDWADMPPERRITEALKRGAILFIHDTRE